MTYNNQDHEVIQILKDLVSIKSVNPYYDNGGKGEVDLANYIEDRFNKSEFIVTRQQVFPERHNIIIELRTGNENCTLVFEAHMDTVSLGKMIDPLKPTQVRDRLYGRGSCDTKGALAGMIYALERCAREIDSLSCNIVLCASVDEEHTFQGVLSFLKRDMKISGAVIGEPTEGKIIVAHKGCVRFKLIVHGKAAHSSVPHEGLNSIYQMSKIIQFIEEEYAKSLSYQKHPLCGRPTVAVTKINGGTQINIVPETCEIEIDRRIIPGEDPNIVMLDIKQQLRKKFHDIKFTIEEQILDWPLNTNPEASIVNHAQKVASNLDMDANMHGVSFSSNASKFQGIKGIPSIVIGPGSISQAHSNEEWVSIDQVEKLAEFYFQLARCYGEI